jgi:hypothetical protein
VVQTGDATKHNFTCMNSGARTPEELETLLEDAFVVRDGDALAGLFEAGGVLVDSDRQRQARGGEEIARFAIRLQKRDYVYLAAPRQVLQARDTALVLAEQGINVGRRGSDGRWRYAIAVLNIDDTAERNKR